MSADRDSSSQRPHSDLDSRELLALAKTGDSQALGRLFARYLPSLQRWAHRRVPQWARNAADTGDLVQDTVLNSLRNLGSFEPQRPGALLGYLRVSLLNRVKDQYRQSALHRGPRELDEHHAAATTSPLEFAIGQQNRERYLDALGRLRAADRHAIIGRLDLGYNYEQLALMLRKPSGEAARLAVRRALLRLAQEMRCA